MKRGIVRRLPSPHYLPFALYVMHSLHSPHFKPVISTQHEAVGKVLHVQNFQDGAFEIFVVLLAIS